MHRAFFMLMMIVTSVNSFGQTTTRGNTTKYSYPRIVAKIHLTGQTSAIPTTTILTPKKNGLFRISAYSSITAPGCNDGGAWDLIFGWADDAGAEQTPFLEPPFLLGCGWVPPYDHITITLAVRDNAGMPLTYSVANGDATGSTYELFITIEQLM